MIAKDLELIRTRLTALKEILQEVIDEHIAGGMTSVGILDEKYDAIRRIEAIERILYGEVF